MIHAPLYPPANPARVEGPLQIPPLAGARSNPLPSGRDGETAGEGGPLPSPAVDRGAATYLPVAAMEAVLAERMRQIHDFGHTPQADAELPLKQLPRAAARLLTAAIEDCQFQRGDWRKAARKHLARAGAMILAALDRLDAEPPEPEIDL